VAQHPERLASIIVRVHGRNRLICAEALTTLANQTYPNLEVLVVEDRGTFCLELSETFRAAGLNIRHIVNAEGGRARSANIGLAAASGDYLGFLDYDDLLMPDHLEALIQALEHAPNALLATGMAWAIHTHYRFCASDFYYREVYYQQFQPDRFVIGARELARENVLPIQAALFRREAYERLGGMDEGLPGYEDWELWRRYAADGDFIVIPKMTSLFRFRGMGHHNKTKADRQKRATDEIRKRQMSGSVAAGGRGLKDNDSSRRGLAL
jgi:glycosyltransferase involved in cell wall biosynthesis